jgi:succinyl-CoA synthetase beta subunit
MAKLFEYQGKSLLAKEGISIPQGIVADDPSQVGQFAESNGGRPVVIKAQAWVTGRAGAGGIRFAEDPRQAEEEADKVLGMNLKGFTVNQVLVEEKLDIDKEFYVGMVVNDAASSPIIMFSSIGGTGIEEIAAQHPDKIVRHTVSVGQGLKAHHARNMLVQLDIRGKLQDQLAGFLQKFYGFCRKYEHRSAEINPLVLTKAGQLVAADCHAVIDDYAVPRHPELGIPIAREFDRPPTPLEIAAYKVETKDHRGTFYFFQMATKEKPSGPLVGFHGAGGGGSMMSMDALLEQGFEIANFCDTSGNPSSSKVYRAAKMILSQGNLAGYFASGSGVASQEQFHSARGLVKAFREARLSIPAVIRIGGNSEEIAIDILTRYTTDLKGKIEAYGRDTSAAYCAKRLKALIDEGDASESPSQPPSTRHPSDSDYRIDTLTGAVFFDHKRCEQCEQKPCIEACTAKVLTVEDAHPVLAIPAEDAKKGRCTECLACELACEFLGNRGLYIDLPIPGMPE